MQTEHAGAAGESRASSLAVARERAFLPVICFLLVFLLAFHMDSSQAGGADCNEN